jgi:Spy/CpxP family protein refolding chaperone
MVLSQLDIARNAIRNQPGIPKDIRDKVLVRLDKARASVEKRMSNAKLDDLEKLGQEMEKMGEEIEQAMEGLEDDLAKLDVDLQQQLGKRLGNLQLDLDLDADDDRSGIPMPPGGLDDDDLKDAMADLKDLALKPAQRDAIRKLRADSDKTVAAAKQQLDDASAKLRAALANPATSDADIARQVDQISAHEASIRKARLVAWNQARRVLDEAQRKRLQDAAQKKTR